MSDPPSELDISSQPNPYAGSLSQPAISGLLSLPTANVARTASEGNEAAGRYALLAFGQLTRSNYINDHQFQQHVMALIEDRLNRRGIKSPHLDIKNIRWALPLS
jgi:hypothetical protein